MILEKTVYSDSPRKRSGNKQKQGARLCSQRGVSLIELMVGITIGLLTVAVAFGALMVSRGISGTVSDASNIQQQAAYAMRVIGLQLRQSGSLRLNLEPTNSSTAAEPYLAAVTFETDFKDPTDESVFAIKDTIKGKESPGSGEYKLSVGYRNYTEPLFVFTTASQESLLRNCLGGKGTNASILSEFVLFIDPTNANRRELRCNGQDIDPQVQPIVNNVANFQVRYLLQDNTSTPGDSKIRSVDANGVTDWAQVRAVEVCLVLYGEEAIDMPTDGSASYTDCDGTTKVNMTTLAGARARRMHIPFRNVFQLRSAGLVGSVL